MWDYAAIASTGANTIGAVSSYWGAKEANRTNAHIADDQMRFQNRQNEKAMAFSERMSNTEWQRGIADMRAAGINPMLAVTKGGASAPSGVTSSGSNYTAQNTLAHIPQSVTSAIQALQTQAQIENLNADSRLKEANAANTMAQLPTTTAKGAIESSLLTDVGNLYRNVKNSVTGNAKGSTFDNWGRAIGNAVYDTQQYMINLPKQIGSSAKAVSEALYQQRTRK